MYREEQNSMILVETATVRDRLYQSGFRLYRFFSVADYNNIAPPGFRLPQHAQGFTVGMLVANQRALWSCFIDHLQKHPERIAQPDPLDRYTEDCFALALQGFTQKTIVRYAHQMETSPIAMQHLAEVCGFARRSKSHLCIHPKYGPWIGFRGVVLFEKSYAVPAIDSSTTGCTSLCAERCASAFEKASLLLRERTHEEIGENWREWAKIRMLCAVGQEYKYSPAQLEYHYTHEKEILRREVEQFTGVVD